MNHQTNNLSKLKIHKSHTTHSGGKGEYFHDWYGYLEGFSSEFVKSIINTYMPDAKYILEPFAGVGTTPISLATLGINCGYSEINPAMQIVIKVKSEVLKLPRSEKKKLSNEIKSLANIIDQRIINLHEDNDLRESYKLTFKDSQYFEDDTFSLILKTRSLIDSINLKNKLLGQLLEVAVMSIIVRCSLLKRAGDVRFKTKKEVAKGIPNYIENLKKQLFQMSDDCLIIPDILSENSLVADNAKELINQNTLEADGVITSPPYLNGTNYIKNTKLELWFTRHLITDKDLKKFRNEVVTSGINDVQKEKVAKIHEYIKPLHAELVSKTYDKRIPIMVAGYFYDMSIVLDGLAKNTKQKSRICIDIGDSIYFGVHVPTHEILVEIAKDYNLTLVESILLRERRSHNGSPLSQVLLVLENNSKTNFSSKNDANIDKSDEFMERWEIFKTTLPHMKLPYSKRSWGNGLHSVCSYQGKMKPALASFLVKTFSDEGDIVLDPFSGSGTIPLEAALNNRKALGIDISLLATSLSNAKLMSHDENEVFSIIENLSEYLESASPSKQTILDSQEVKFNKTIAEYFHPETLNEILIARDFFIKNHIPENGNWSLVFSCLLHILHGNRPYALSRNSHPITPYAPTGEFIYKNLIKHLLQKVNKSLDTERGDNFLPGYSYKTDILESWPDTTNNVNAIITSPPFFDSTKFYMTNWMRYWFCGWGRDDFTNQAKSFIEVLQKKSFSSYEIIFQKCHEKLAKNGIVVFHLGFSKKCDMANELRPIAEQYFKILDIFNESVEHCQKHGVSDQGSVKNHQYLVMKKTD